MAELLLALLSACEAAPPPLSAPPSGGRPDITADQLLDRIRSFADSQRLTSMAQVESAFGIRIGPPEQERGDRARARVSGWLAYPPDNDTQIFPRYGFHYRSAATDSTVTEASLWLWLGNAPCLSLSAVARAFVGSRRWRLSLDTDTLHGDYAPDTPLAMQRRQLAFAGALVLSVRSRDGSIEFRFLPETDPCASDVRIFQTGRS